MIAIHHGFSISFAGHLPETRQIIGIDEFLTQANPIRRRSIVSNFSD
jgi:hypothetical protein